MDTNRIARHNTVAEQKQAAECAFKKPSCKATARTYVDQRQDALRAKTHRLRELRLARKAEAGS